MGDKKKKKEKDRQKERSKSIQKQRDRKKSKRKEKEKQREKSKRDRKKEKKQKSKRDRREKSSSSSMSSSSDSSDSSSSSSSRERSRSKKRNKKRDKKKPSKSVEKQTVSNIPFGMSQPAAVAPPVMMGAASMVTPFRGGPFLNPGVSIQPPTQNPTTSTTVSKTKTKEYHIFKLFPKLPAGPVTLARTIYSSSLLTPEFQQKFLGEMCDELEKSAKAEGSKKMSSLMSKHKGQICSVAKDRQLVKEEVKEETPKIEYSMDSVRKSYQCAMQKLKMKISA